jgi:hypothetical protein
MIDLVENFKQHEKKITTKADEQFNSYYNSRCRERLVKRVERLTDSDNMRSGVVGQFMAQLNFPIVKNMMIMRNAILDQNYRGDNLISVQKVDGLSTEESAKHVEGLLKSNFRQTRFRERDFSRIKKSVSNYGTGVSYSHFDVLSTEHLKTQRTELGYERLPLATNEELVRNKNVHILNYGLNPDIAYREDSEFEYHMERIDLALFQAMVLSNKDRYIKDNVRKIIIEAQGAEGAATDKYYGAKDPAGHPVDLIKMFSTLNIKGNEDNTSRYYLEIINHKIVRIEKELIDENEAPYSIFTIMPRIDTWWGGLDSEMGLSSENLYNLIMNMKADNVIKSMDQINLYVKGAIDIADLQNRHNQSGFVGVDLKESQSVRDLFYTFQTPDQGLAGEDSTLRELNSNLQTIKAAPDLYKANTRTSPVQNTTATAVNAIENQGDIKEGFYMTNFDAGLTRMANLDIIIFQQMLSDNIRFRPDSKSQMVAIAKEEIFGRYDYLTKTSLTNNKVSELIRKQNVINTVMNWKGTQLPEVAMIQLGPMIKRWIQDTQMGEVDELFNEQQAANPQLQFPPQQGAPQNAQLVA